MECNDRRRRETGERKRKVNESSRHRRRGARRRTALVLKRSVAAHLLDWTRVVRIVGECNVIVEGSVLP